MTFFGTSATSTIIYALAVPRSARNSFQRARARPDRTGGGISEADKGGRTSPEIYQPEDGNAIYVRSDSAFGVAPIAYTRLAEGVKPR